MPSELDGMLWRKRFVRIILKHSGFHHACDHNFWSLHPIGRDRAAGHMVTPLVITVGKIVSDFPSTVKEKHFLTVTPQSTGYLKRPNFALIAPFNLLALSLLRHCVGNSVPPEPHP
jgi:hypothetical protein